jgi:LCP family protein required for cell wall assembly
MKEKPKRKRPVLRVVLIVLGVVCVASLGILGYMEVKLSSMQKDVVPVTSKPTIEASATPALAPSLIPIEGTPEDIDEDHDDSIETDQIDKDPIYNTDAIDEGVINILIMGEDTRPNEATAGRSDSMMLLSYNTGTNEAKLVSFLRDTYIYIPERGAWNRINVAYRMGGIGLTINTINENFGLDIQDYIITDFSNMVKIVDVLGGLELPLTQKEAEYINTYTQGEALPEEEGTYLLTGEQVLAHCRNRKTGDGDWGRTARQRQVLLALFNRVKQERDVSALASLANKLLQYVRTNIDAATLIQLGADAVFSDNFTLKGGAMPFGHTWHYASIDGRSVIKIDLEKNKELLHELLFGISE